MNYKINQIFRDDDDYINKASFCNENGLQIIELAPDENGRRFQIVKPSLTPEEIKQNQMNELKQQLADMDYKTSKYVDGEYTQEEWAKIVAERKAIRERIRELEKLI